MYARWRRRERGRGLEREKRKPIAAHAATPREKANPALRLPPLFSSLFPSKKKYAATPTIAGSTKRAATGATRCSAFGPVNPLSKKKPENVAQGTAKPGGTNGNASDVVHVANVAAPTSALSNMPPF